MEGQSSSGAVAVVSPVGSPSSSPRPRSRWRSLVPGYAIAANAAAATVFYGCSAADNSVKLITAGTPPVCKAGETLQSWNAQGPQGIPGEPGQPGQPGAQVFCRPGQCRRVPA